MVRDHSLVVVYTYAYVAVEKYYKTYQNFYGNQRLFRQINVFTIEVTKDLISRILWNMIVFYGTFPYYCGTYTNEYEWKNETFTLTEKNFVRSYL